MLFGFAHSRLLFLVIREDCCSESACTFFFSIPVSSSRLSLTEREGDSVWSLDSIKSAWKKKKNRQKRKMSSKSSHRQCVVVCLSV